MAKFYLTIRYTYRLGTNVGHSDPIILMWYAYRSTDKRYVGDNRLIILKRSYRWNSLAPLCRLNISRCRIGYLGFGCSPIKMLRELGL